MTEPTNHDIVSPDSGVQKCSDPNAVGSASDMMPPPPPSSMQRIVKKLDPVIAKTKLDLEACAAVVDRMVSKQEKSNELRLTQTPQDPSPIKQIERYRRAIPCNAAWDDMAGGDKYRLCAQCKLFVYEFKDMQQQEADDLVFKREGRQPKTFYRRTDGRFLSSDCPVALRRRRTILGVIVGGVLLLIGSIALVSSLPPPPPKPATSSPTPTPAAPPAPSTGLVESGSRTKPSKASPRSNAQAGYSLPPSAAPIEQRELPAGIWGNVEPPSNTSGP